MGKKFIGIDYGTKRIGVAISDENASLAFPKEIILNGRDTFKRIGELIESENISEIVVGESVDFSGRLNILSARIDDFISELSDKFGLPIHKQKEFLTSVEARRYENLSGQAHKEGNTKNRLSLSKAHSRIKQIKSGRVDASAAALILQRYLDRLNKLK